MTEFHQTTNTGLPGVPGRIKILFVIPDLYRGGAQRVFLNLLKFFNTSRFDITLAVLIKSKENNFQQSFPEGIEVIQYDFPGTKQAFIPLLRLINRGNYQVVLSTLTHLNIIMSVIKLMVRKPVGFIARESNTIGSSLRDEKFPGLFRFLIKRLYKNFDLIICQSKAMANDLVDNFNISFTQLKVIYNPVDCEHIKSSTLNDALPTSTEKERVELLCVGRLYPQKGYDRLMQVLAALNNFPFRLRIIGSGVLEAELRALATGLGIGKSVEFLGAQENPFKFMKASDCLLLPSYYEGLPNVVLEANVCGLPVIAFNSPGGTSEVIEDGKNGWLVKDGDLQGFADRIRSMDFKKIDRQKISADACRKFSLKEITSEYEDAVIELINASR